MNQVKRLASLVLLAFLLGCATVNPSLNQVVVGVSEDTFGSISTMNVWCQDPVTDVISKCTDDYVGKVVVGISEDEWGSISTMNVWCQDSETQQISKCG